MQCISKLVLSNLVLILDKCLCVIRANCYLLDNIFTGKRPKTIFTGSYLIFLINKSYRKMNFCSNHIWRQVRNVIYKVTKCWKVSSRCRQVKAMFTRCNLYEQKFKCPVQVIQRMSGYNYSKTLRWLTSLLIWIDWNVYYFNLWLSFEAFYLKYWICSYNVFLFIWEFIFVFLNSFSTF